MKSLRAVPAVMASLLAGLLLLATASCDDLFAPKASPTPSPSFRPHPSLPPLPTPIPGAQVIADHEAVERWEYIPDEYIEAVKLMWINVPGESHSQGYRTGLGLVEALDSRFATEAKAIVSPPDSNDFSPAISTANGLRVSRSYWNGSAGVWGTGESAWYTSAAAIVATKAHLDHYNGPAGNIPITAMGFGWCWDMSWINGPSGSPDPVHLVRWAGSSEGGPEGNRIWGLDADDQPLTQNSVSLQTYLDATQAYADYCASKGYATKVFYTTGPVDGYDGENGYQRQLKHDAIRAWVLADSTRILFDYADILAWNDEREEHTQTWTDGEGGSHSYQMIHPGNSGSEPSHIGTEGELRLGKAMWWLLARIAGWDGVSQ